MSFGPAGNSRRITQWLLAGMLVWGVAVADEEKGGGGGGDLRSAAQNPISSLICEL